MDFVAPEPQQRVWSGKDMRLLWLVRPEGPLALMPMATWEARHMLMNTHDHGECWRLHEPLRDRAPRIVRWAKLETRPTRLVTEHAGSVLFMENVNGPLHFCCTGSCRVSILRRSCRKEFARAACLPASPNSGHMRLSDLFERVWPAASRTLRPWAATDSCYENAHSVFKKPPARPPLRFFWAAAPQTHRHHS